MAFRVELTPRATADADQAATYIKQFAPDAARRWFDGLMRAVIHHEYQHATWIREVRDTFTDVPAPTPGSERLGLIEGYYVLTS